MQSFPIKIRAHVQRHGEFDGYRTVTSHQVEYSGDPASLIRAAVDLVAGARPSDCIIQVSPIEPLPGFRVCFDNDPDRRSVAFEVPLAHLPLCLAYILAGGKSNGFIMGPLGTVGGGTRKKRPVIRKAPLAEMACPSVSSH